MRRLVRWLLRDLRREMPHCFDSALAAASVREAMAQELARG